MTSFVGSHTKVALSKDSRAKVERTRFPQKFKLFLERSFREKQPLPPFLPKVHLPVAFDELPWEEQRE